MEALLLLICFFLFKGIFLAVGDGLTRKLGTVG